MIIFFSPLSFFRRVAAAHCHYLVDAYFATPATDIAIAGYML